MIEFGASAAWPLVGREVELGVIRDALREGCVVVVAPAGAGKSRLAREAVAAETAALTGWVQATRSAAAIPLGAFVDLVPDDRREDDTPQLLHRSADALEARAGGRRIVLGVDDAQLLDPVSASLVALLVERGVRVLATVRSGEPVPEAIETLPAVRVELGPLDDRAVAAMLESALGGPAEEAAVGWIVESSQGNPLYVRELVAGAAQSGALREAAGLWRLDARPAVGGSLRDLIAERLGGRREVAELLSLSEPLTTQELTALCSEEALRQAAALVAIDGDQVRLAHPLYGEVAAAELPSLRGRQLRLRLAETLQRRDPITPNVALRVARLLVDAGAEIPGALRLEAARAANLAGDPGLAAELAEPALDQPGLTAALILARAHVLRNRAEEAEAVLAAAEDRAPGDPRAGEYVTQRTWNLNWALNRNGAALALLDRVLGWSDDPAWVRRWTEHLRMQAAAAEGFSVAAIDAGERGSTEGSPSQDAYAAMAALFSGDGESAAEIARRIRPRVPMRSYAEAPALATSALIPLETGIGWTDVEAFMAGVLPEAVRGGDHEAAGSAALTLGSLECMRGRYRDAARRLAEAQLHHERQDSVGQIVYVHAFQVGAAAATGDFDATAAALARIDAAIGSRGALHTQQPFILRAQGWAARLRSDAEAAQHFVAASEQLDGAPIFAASLAYEALRSGADVAPRLRELATRAPAPLMVGFRMHAEAREEGDGARLLAAAEAFATIGATRYAMEAAAEASSAFLREGRGDSARRAGERVRELHQPDQGTEPPRIDGLESAAVELTPREVQIIDLARRGLSNTEIGERLLLSRRTIESHIYRAMIKLGISDRRAL